jgi:uncharacterized protein Usg
LARCSSEEAVRWICALQVPTMDGFLDFWQRLLPRTEMTDKISNDDKFQDHDVAQVPQNCLSSVKFWERSMSFLFPRNARRGGRRTQSKPRACRI